MSAAMARALLPLLLLASCGGPPAPSSPVPLEGPRRDIRRLAGTWAGEFVSSSGPRHGTIMLTIEPGRDTAHGQVLLEGAAPPQATPAGADGTVLRLGRIVIADGSVAGWIESYPDLELGCPVDTWFEGRLVRDTLEGMFFAHPAEGDTVRRGTWWAARAAR